MFRTAFKRLRCIVPASGYYEWKTINGAQQPFYFSAADDGVLSIAGLWDEWNDRSGPTGPILSCTLIVTAANEFAGRIHDRMPVFLQSENFAAWLDGSAGPELLKPASKDLLMEWSCRAPAPPASDAETGRLSNGASPCPTNQSRPLPRWASILARIRSTSSASIDAAQSCCGRGGHAGKSKRGSRQCRCA
jgi:hypothetical protein